jgi:hypothetical protein
MKHWQNLQLLVVVEFWSEITQDKDDQDEE